MIIAAFWAVFFVARGGDRCGLHCPVFGLGLVSAVVGVNDSVDGVAAVGRQDAILAQEFLILWREGRSGWGSGGWFRIEDILSMYVSRFKQTPVLFMLRVHREISAGYQYNRLGLLIKWRALNNKIPDFIGGIYTFNNTWGPSIYSCTPFTR